MSDNEYVSDASENYDSDVSVKQKQKKKVSKKSDWYISSGDEETSKPKRNSNKKNAKEGAAKRVVEKKKVLTKKRPADSDNEDSESEKRRPADKKKLPSKKRPVESDANDSEVEDIAPKKTKRPMEVAKAKKGKKSEEPIEVDYEMLQNYVSSAFNGETKAIVYKENLPEVKDLKLILNALMNQYAKLSDDCMRINYTKCVYLLSQVWLHHKEFQDTEVSNFEDYLNTLEIEVPAKWNWPVMKEPLNSKLFNNACEMIFLSLYQPKIEQEFQEFVSPYGNENGFSNLLPFTDLSRKKGTKLANSTAVHMGIGVSGNFMMMGRHVTGSQWERAITICNTKALSNEINGSPPINVQCGTMKDQVRIGTMEKFLLLMGGFAELQVNQGAEKEIYLRLRSLVCVKVGYESSLSSGFKKYIVRNTIANKTKEDEDEEEEVEEDV